MYSNPDVDQVSARISLQGMHSYYMWIFNVSVQFDAVLIPILTDSTVFYLQFVPIKILE